MTSPRVGLSMKKPKLRIASKDAVRFPSIQERDEELSSDRSGTNSMEEDESPQSNYLNMQQKMMSMMI